MIIVELRIEGTKYCKKQDMKLEKIPSTVPTVRLNLLFHSASESQKSNNRLHQRLCQKDHRNLSIITKNLDNEVDN